MGDIGADVHVILTRAQEIEKFGEGFPFPGNPLRHHHAGDILNPFHQTDEVVMIVRSAGRETDAAVAHDRGCHAMGGGGGEPLRPGGLRVIMRMDIDKAGRDQLAAGVDDLIGGAVNPADGRNFPVQNGDIGLKRFSAASIRDGSVLDDDIIMHVTISLLCPADVFFLF